MAVCRFIAVLLQSQKTPAAAPSAACQMGLALSAPLLYFLPYSSGCERSAGGATCGSSSLLVGRYVSSSGIGWRESDVTTGGGRLRCQMWSCVLSREGGAFVEE